MRRALWLPWLLLAASAVPAYAQEIQPLNVEPDINGVNLITGEARRPVLALQIPAAPNLRLERLNMLLPMLSGTVTHSGGAGDYAVNRGGLTSESFDCPQDAVCTDEQGSGSGLQANFSFCGSNCINGSAQYTEAGSGRRVFFGPPGQLGVSTSSGTGQLAYYATSISYPNGETLSFTYQTLSGGGATIKRPTQVTSNLGYVMALTWRGNNPTHIDSQTLATAAIYDADDMATPLARHTYAANGGITDLAGRIWSCCGDLLSSPAEAPAFAMRLPGMGNDSFTATSSPFGSLDHWVTEYVSDGVAYDYAYVVKSFSGVAHVFPDQVTITGPEGYELVADIDVAHPSSPYPTQRSVITSVTNALGQETNYEYDDFYNRLTRITYPEGNAVSVVYDDAANITQRSVHPKGGGTALTEEADYPIETGVYNCTGAAPDVRCWRPSWTEDEAGNLTNYTWNADGDLLTMLEPAGANGRRRKTVNVYATSGGISRLQSQTICSAPAAAGADDCNSSAAQRTNYTYWQNTLLPLTVSRTNGGTNPAPPVATTTYAYDNAGRVLSEDGPLAGDGDAAYYRYDTSGRRTWEIGRAGANAAHRAATRTTWRAADDQPTLIETGELSSPTDTTLAVSHYADYLYDTRRLATRERTISAGIIYALGQHGYDLRNRRVCSAARMNPQQFASPPASACDLDTTGSMGPDRIQRTTYDVLSRPTQIVGGYQVLNGGAGNVEIKLGYTANGQVLWREDGEANRTNYTYDGYDRPRRTTFPDASYEELSYDSRSNVTQRRTRAARLILHDYDTAGRLIETRYNSYGTGETPVEYDYDGQGRETRIERPAGSPYDASLITITYDALGRRASETQQPGPGSGQNRTVAWQYDIAGRPTRLTWPDGFYVTYDHSPAAQLTAIRDSAGAALITYGYDVFGRPASLTRANGLVTSYSYDPVARLSRFNHAGLVYTDLTYNPASQMLTRMLSNGAWAWDEAMNVNLTYDVNNLNQYTEVGTTDFAYDLTGNLTDDGPNGYAYDAENRMRWSVRASPAQTVHLRYDGRGRLRRRWGSGAGTADYLYDGDAMIAELNGDTGAVVRRYIHGAGVDDPLIWDEGAGTSNRRYLHADERGSITTVTNATGGIIARNIYDDWGNPGAGNLGRFQYTGQQWLPEIGLYYYKARFYGPGIGRFWQTDPVGYEGGMNLYAYALNDPLTLTDPQGENPLVGLCTRFCPTILRFARPAARPAASATRETGTRLLPAIVGQAGRLASDIASRQRDRSDMITVRRFYGGRSFPMGDPNAEISHWTTDSVESFGSNANVRERLGIDPAWGNTLERVVEGQVRMRDVSTIGPATPVEMRNGGILSGGGTDVEIPNAEENVRVISDRANDLPDYNGIGRCWHMGCVPNVPWQRF